MIQTIILVNVAVVSAYLAGATTDISALVARGERRSKLFAAIAIITLASVVHFTIRNSN